MESISVLPLLISAIVGALVTIFFSLISKKRAKFVYIITHSKVGTTTDDPIFGSIKVLYNDQPAKNLWLSQVEIRNTSLSDFSDVPIRIYAHPPAILLNQTLKINDRYPSDLHLDEEFMKNLRPDEKGSYSEKQHALYNSHRHYKIPVINRGHKIIFTYLIHTPEEIPEINMSIEAAGIKCIHKRLTSFPINFPYVITKGVLLGIALAIPILLVLAANLTDAKISVITGWTLGLLTGSLGIAAAWLWDKTRNFLFN